MSIDSTDVFVIGGGPAGLATAIAASRRGMRVIVADSARPPIDKACGEGLMPDGVAALEALGVRLRDGDASPFRGIRFLESGMAVDAEFPSGRGLGMRRLALHARTIEAAETAGVEMLWGTRATGLSATGVTLENGAVAARWIVGADGENSRVRVWAGLDQMVRYQRRFGFRRHYRVAPWSDFMELYWADGAQIYITPVGPEEVCVAAISRDSRLRVNDVLARCSEAAERLSGAAVATPERGAVTASCRLRAVAAGNVALVGDASGSADAITGEGLCLSFQQALALADALAAGDLASYRAVHVRLAWRPQWIAALMLLFDSRPRLRQRALQAMIARPSLFARMLAMHVGGRPLHELAAAGLELGWHVLRV
jgi:flavin-dependent dehydrogenase